MKKNYYRTTMYDGADESFCSKIIAAAAKSNGGDKEISMETLKAIGDAQKLLYPVLYPSTNCEIIGDSLLHVDRMVGDVYKTVLVIEKIELLEIEPPEYSELEQENGIL